MATNPRRIANTLETLNQQLQRFGSISSELLSAGSGEQRQVRERVERTNHKARILLDRANQDAAAVEEKSISVKAAKSKNEETNQSAATTNRQAVALKQKAREALTHCENELNKAVEWLARAMARLERAIQIYNQAIAALNAANANLSVARSRLNACRADKERK